MAWRNIWRNPTRSLLVLLSVIIGLWAGLFTMSFSNGLFAEQVKNAINTSLSHIQVHHKTYNEEHSLNATLHLPDKLLAQVKKDARIKAITCRYIVPCMMSSANNAAGVNAIGILPEEEDSVTGLYKRIVAGKQLVETKQNGVLVGEKAAQKLRLKVKSKIVLSFQDVDGSITSAAFRVAGIFRSANSTFDESNVYVLAAHAQSLCNSDSNRYHEMAVLLKKNEDLLSVKGSIKKIFPEQPVQDWMELSPELDLMVSSFHLYMYIFIGIILLALGFGIVNTMLMAVLERVREFGVLMAIGMNKRRLFFMIMSETVMLTLAGSPIGLLLSYASIGYFEKHGIDLSMFWQGLTSFGYNPVVHTTLELSYYPQILLMTSLAALLASLFPAIKALELKPADAIRKI